MAEVAAELTWAELTELGLTSQEIAQADIAGIFSDQLSTILDAREVIRTTNLFAIDESAVYVSTASQVAGDLAIYDAAVAVGSGAATAFVSTATSAFESFAALLPELIGVAVVAGTALLAWETLHGNNSQAGRDPGLQPRTSSPSGVPVYYVPATGIIRESQWQSLDQRLQGNKRQRSRSRRR